MAHVCNFFKLLCIALAFCFLGGIHAAVYEDVRKLLDRLPEFDENSPVLDRPLLPLAHLSLRVTFSFPGSIGGRVEYEGTDGLKQILQTEPETDFVAADTIEGLFSTIGENKMVKYQQTFQNVPVFDGIVSVRQRGDNIRINHKGLFSGKVLKHIEPDIKVFDSVSGPKFPSRIFLGDPAVIEFLRDLVGDHDKTINAGFVDTAYTLLVSHTLEELLYPVNGSAVRACEFSYNALTKNGNPSRRCGFYSRLNGQVLDHWDCMKGALFQAVPLQGWGGNTKIGKVKYGTGSSERKVNVTIGKGRCQLANGFVRIVDNHGISNHKFTDSFRFGCCEGSIDDEINGAFSPRNDAYYYGTKTYEMFFKWYRVLPSFKQIVLRVHYGKGFDNAIFDGEAVAFGDGDGIEHSHPYISADIVAHEIAHAFTERTSKIIYREQGGAIDESFCDFIGEGLEYFLKGEKEEPDWLFGADVTVRQTAIRFLHEPKLDGESIERSDQYFPGLSVHRGSGLMNKIFYNIAHSYGFNIRKAIDVYVRANRMYLEREPTYVSAACAAERAAYDLGYDGHWVKDAFMEAGVKCPVEIPRAIVNNPHYGCRQGVRLKIKHFQLDWITRDGHRMKRFKVPDCAHTFRIKVTTPDPWGDPDIFVNRDFLVTTFINLRKATNRGRTEELVIRHPKKGTYLIMVVGRRAMRRSTLTVSYYPKFTHWLPEQERRRELGIPV